MTVQSQAQFEATAPLRDSMQTCLTSLGETLALQRELLRLQVLEVQRKLSEQPDNDCVLFLL